MTIRKSTGPRWAMVKEEKREWVVLDKGLKSRKKPLERRWSPSRVALFPIGQWVLQEARFTANIRTSKPIQHNRDDPVHIHFQCALYSILCSMLSPTHPSQYTRPTAQTYHYNHYISSLITLGSPYKMATGWQRWRMIFLLCLSS